MYYMSMHCMSKCAQYCTIKHPTPYKIHTFSHFVFCVCKKKDVNSGNSQSKVLKKFSCIFTHKITEMQELAISQDLKGIVESIRQNAPPLPPLLNRIFTQSFTLQMGVTFAVYHFGLHSRQESNCFKKFLLPK